MGGEKVKESMAVPAWLRVTIEDELRHYPIAVITLERARAEIIQASPAKGVGRSSNPSDPTFGIVSRLCSTDMLRMEWYIGAIESVYRASTPEIQRVIRLYYWQGLSSDEAAYNLGVSRTTLWRLRQTIIKMVAFRLGIIRPYWGATLYRGIQPSRANDETNAEHLRAV